MIIAIGGGEISTGETISIDKFIIAQAKKENPKLLFIPTASNDAIGYIETVKRVYGNLGCYVDSLCLIANNYQKYEIKKKILDADIVYVGGGNTANMMKVWKQFKVDQYLLEANKRGTILSGLSAVAICWFKSGHSDSEILEGKENPSFRFVRGLGLIPYIVCPHYEEIERKAFDIQIKEKAEDGIALEGLTALVYEDDAYRIIRADKASNAFLFRKGIKKQLEPIDI
ncbi:MAG: peptidase E [Bacilli bacterium]|nr:peptidase E [Bacilli bacterium]